MVFCLKLCKRLNLINLLALHFPFSPECTSVKSACYVVHDSVLMDGLMIVSDCTDDHAILPRATTKGASCGKGRG